MDGVVWLRLRLMWEEGLVLRVWWWWWWWWDKILGER